MRSPRYLLCLALALIASLFALIYPAYVIRPFRYQGPTELRAALAVLQIRPILQICLGVISVVLAVLVWGRTRRIAHRVTACILAALTIGTGILSHINIYELMFHPIGEPRYVAANQSKLNSAEQVIAIDVNGAARAYPIRITSYHHIVNDNVGGVPVVATY